jgi:hypothetical protein
MKQDLVYRIVTFVSDIASGKLPWKQACSVLGQDDGK